MSDTSEKKKFSVLAFLKSNFIAGILILLPLVLTYQIVSFMVIKLDNLLIGIIPRQFQPESLFNFNIYGLGLTAGFLLIVSVGILTRNFIGRQLAGWADGLFSSIPGVRSVYGAIKQIVNTIGQANSTSFREVVLVEYPRKDIWALAFVTGKTKGEVSKMGDEELINVFLPTTPNPTSGFLLFVPKKDLRTMHMTVDQGIKMVISAGIVTPTTSEGKTALEKQQKEERRLVQDDGDHIPKRRKNDK